MIRVDIYDDTEALARALAEVVIASAQEAIELEGRFLLCLAGADVPTRAYQVLASEGFSERVDWRRTHVFFVDERCTPEEGKSHYRMAHQALLARVPLVPGRVHRIACDRDPHEAARAYEGILLSVLGGSVRGTPGRSFDLVLLGMGEDGRTASLFPGSVDEPDRWASARICPGAGAWVTLTPRLLNTARAVRVAVEGREKAARLGEALRPPRRPLPIPVHRIRPVGSLRWMVDREAASNLTVTPTQWWRRPATEIRWSRSSPHAAGGPLPAVGGRHHTASGPRPATTRRWSTPHMEEPR